jgi:iron-sulfur cluster assembly protein
MAELSVIGNQPVPDATGTVEVTEAAANAIGKYLREHNAAPGAGLRIGIRGGGCSGLSYVLDVDATPRANDKVIDAYGQHVFIDPKSFVFLQGSVLDYVTGLMEAGFKFINPRASKSCGCGESFSM